MDFGSSHVYAGAPYYSDVPNENTVTHQNDTIYEAVNEIYEPAEQNEEHPYDPVAFDSPENERRDYDLVPYEPGLDAANSENSSAPRPAHPKRSLSSGFLHKAKKVTNWKSKKNKTRSTSSVAEVDDEPPTPPPPRRSIRNDPLPPVPDCLPRSNSHNKPLPSIPGEYSLSGDSTQEFLPAPPKIPPKPSSFKSKPAAQIMPVEQLADIFSCNSVSATEKSSLSEPLKPVVTSPKPLYPILQNVYADVNRNYQKTGLIASAPPLEATPSTQQPASAPPLSASMIKRDTRSNAKSKPKNQYAEADTNVVSVKLGILENGENSMVWAMPPLRCKQCQAVLLHHAAAEDQDSGVCRFCGSKNTDVVQSVLPLVGNESDITYVLDQNAPVTGDDPIIVFCIDTSGSMCVTSEVGAGFLSRLQGVKDGIIMQLNHLRQTRPNVRVAIVTFSNMVVLLGDGSPEQYMAFNDAQLYDTDYIKATTRNAVIPGPIQNTHQQLMRTINLLKEHGGTALGPALFLSVALASRKRGSQVIVCTDGRANVGIGSLELESDYKMCHHFYKETSDFGIQMGTMVSILSIEGTDCRLVELGKVADKTAGKVKIVNSQSISNEFHDILSSSLMATQVDTKIVTQNQLFFHDSESSCQTSVGSFVGNATKDTEITFKYGIQESEQNSPPQDALFQLQVRYLLKSGCTCLRVITQSRPVTENRQLAEQGLNPAVVGTYASQVASRLVLDGDLRDAKLTTDAHKKLISRAMSIRSTYSERLPNETEDRIYGSVCYHMDELNNDIQKVVDSVRPTPSPTPSGEVPPPLPPRPSESPLSMSRSSSMASLSLPDVPNTPLATKEKLMEAVENCPDEVARQLYKHRAACGSMFAAF